MQTDYVECKVEPGQYEHGDSSGVGQMPAYTSMPVYQSDLTQDSGSIVGSVGHIPEHGGFVQVKRPNSEPPFFVDSEDEERYNDLGTSPRPHKRVQHGRPSGLRSYASEMLPPPTSALNSPYSTHSYISSTSSAPQPFSSGTLLTPTSAYNDDFTTPYNGGNTAPLHDAADLRRLSINSLLSGGPSSQYLGTHPQTPRSNSDNQESSIQYRDIYTDHTTYGIDRGVRDLDYGKNDDANAISPTSSMTGREHLSMILNDSDVMGGSGSTVGSPKIVVDEPAYYDKPVPINIPRLLEPLPTLLLENSMNLLVGYVVPNMMHDLANIVLVLCM